jgi:hypothetical protein
MRSCDEQVDLCLGISLFCCPERLPRLCICRFQIVMFSFGVQFSREAHNDTQIPILVQFESLRRKFSHVLVDIGDFTFELSRSNQLLP